MVETITIYHNPRCTKSRLSLSILEKTEFDVQIVEYLKTPLAIKDLVEISQKLDKPVKEFIRKGEPIYRELKLAEVKNEEELLQIMVDNPILIERPIVVRGEKAKIGRPPEDILTLLEG